MSVAISGARNSNGSITVATDKGWTNSLGMDFETPPAIMMPIMKVYSSSAFTDVQVIQDDFLIVCPERRADCACSFVFYWRSHAGQKTGPTRSGTSPARL